MQKFVYRMQSLLTIDQKLEEQAKTAFGAAKTQLNTEEERLRALWRKREAYVSQKKEAMTAKLDLRKVAMLQAGIDAADGQIERQKMRVKKAEKLVEAAEARLREAMADRKTQERLKENAFEQYKRDFEAEEQKGIDELVSYTFGSRGREEEA